MLRSSSRSIRGERQRSEQIEQSKVTDLSSLYNSKTLSDVTVILPPETGKKRKFNDDGEPAPEDAALEKIFAHKVILGSGSRVYKEYFEEVRYAAQSSDAHRSVRETPLTPERRATAPAPMSNLPRCAHMARRCRKSPC